MAPSLLRIIAHGPHTVWRLTAQSDPAHNGLYVAIMTDQLHTDASAARIAEEARAVVARDTASPRARRQEILPALGAVDAGEGEVN